MHYALNIIYKVSAVVCAIQHTKNSYFYEQSDKNVGTQTYIVLHVHIKVQSLLPHPNIQ